jgi:hypothetical protein
MIKTDMDWKAKRISLQDEREHKTRLFRIWLTMLVVVAIAGMATGVILAGQPVAGSVLATVDLVALAHVLERLVARVGTDPVEDEHRVVATGRDHVGHLLGERAHAALDDRDVDDARVAGRDGRVTGAAGPVDEHRTALDRLVACARRQYQDRHV